MARIPWILAVLCAMFALASAFSAPTFCKCSCFTNSTIIPLGPQHPTPADGSSPPPGKRSSATSSLDRALYERQSAALDARASSASCTQCNRAFCLDYNLPICKGAEEKDVVAMCFQRDSRKDQIIVWCFILGTAGLLGWTAVQRLLQLREARAAATSRAPLLGGGSGGSGPNNNNNSNREMSAGGGGNLFQRAAARIGLGGRGGSGAGHGGPGGGLRSPRSPSAAGPRGQYAPLGGNSGD